MRRRDREIESTNELLAVIDACQVMRIGMYDEDGVYILPMNFGYTFEDDKLTFYIHGALEGKKLDLIKQNHKVGFELDCDHKLIEGKVACQYGFHYSSIVGKGIAKVITDPQEKIKGMSILMKSMTGKDFEFNEKLVSIVSVIKITATEFTGKRRD
jgi:Predicted flavin-nucleotide-binding protein